MYDYQHHSNIVIINFIIEALYLDLPFYLNQPRRVTGIRKAQKCNKLLSLLTIKKTKLMAPLLPLLQTEYINVNDCIERRKTATSKEPYSLLMISFKRIAGKIWSKRPFFYSDLSLLGILSLLALPKLSNPRRKSRSYLQHTM